ncbi:MAG TPA: J domain-containing protein [Caulobacteraceae bacterium]|nr:J domain-containing protein [Caulobacteraceae bacterium]
MARDPYQELGVPRGASADEIRKAFRKLAKQHHPDTNPGDKASEERFKRVSAAFDILGDEEKRKKFDRGEIDADGREQHRGFGGGGGQGPWGGGGGQPRGGFQGAQFEGVDLDDILGDVFGGRRGGGGGGGGFGFGGGRGADVRARLDIDLEDAINGATRRVSFSDGRAIDISIPKGAVEGQILRLKGQGHHGPRGAGDALIELHFKPHPIFKKKKDVLQMDVPIGLPEAVLGGKVQAPTPDGPVSLKVPKGTNSGAVLRLKGRGLYNARTGRRGDLLARLIVTLPDEPDAALEAFAEEMRRERPYTPKRRV